MTTQSYIVRIYRRGEGSPEEVVGLVEQVETGREAAFHSFDELRTVLAAKPRRKGRRRGARGREEDIQKP